MGFIDYLKSLIAKNSFNQENRLKDIVIENNNQECKPMHYGEIKTTSSKKSSNLVSTTTTIINKKKISKIVKSSYVRNKTNDCPQSFRYYRIASPIAESSSLYSQAFDQKNLKIKIESKRHPFVNFQREVLDKDSRSRLMNKSKKIGYCQMRDKYSACMQYEIVKKNNLTYGSKFKIKKKKRRIGDLRSREKSAYEFIRPNQMPPCCMINGKPLKFKKRGTSFFELKSVNENRKEKRIEQNFERIHLKKSKAMSDIKRVDFFSDRGIKNRMSSTVNTNVSSSSIDLFKKRTPRIRSEFSHTKKNESNRKFLINKGKSNDGKKFCSTFIVDFCSTPVKTMPKTSTPVKQLH